MSTISNRGAYHEFFIEDTYTAGMVLAGTEVKSIREGKVSFNDSYCLFHKGELWIKSLYIGEYSFGTDHNHIATQDRKLLLHKREMDKIQAKMKEKGYTLVPLKIFFNDKSLAKMEIGLAKGKKLHDKRDTLKAKDSQREMARFLKR
jgi:SsrA-binding protein